MARKFKALLSIVLPFIMAGAGQAFAAPVKILALGTSLTQGYGLPPGTEFTVQLQAALKRSGIDAVVTNAGVSGDTSAGGLARLDWSLADHPDAVILELGGNDMLRGIAPAETEKNLRVILARLKAAHVKTLLTGMHAQRNLGAEYVQQFDAIYPRLAKDYNVLFYPFILDGVALNPKLNQADGMHPNPAGVKVIVTRILPLVKKLVGH
ncbi:MAG TPA: arylesterase [Rhizomicrobium sp.]|nr:arylesterase [Rhizomicrobium sp.]